MAAYARFDASKRATLLATERERAQRLNELNALRSDFSAMIAHELETPIAAVRKLNEMLSLEGEDPGVRAYATTATEGELDALTNLVRDVRAVAAVEREDFEIDARRLPLEKLLTDAESLFESRAGLRSRRDLGHHSHRFGHPDSGQDHCLHMRFLHQPDVGTLSREDQRIVALNLTTHI